MHEGFDIYNISRTDDGSKVQLLRNAPISFGDVEAIDIAFQRLDDGYRFDLCVGVHGRDIINVLPGGLEILENAVCDVVRGSPLSRYTVGIVGMGALNAYDLQKRLLGRLYSLSMA